MKFLFSLSLFPIYSFLDSNIICIIKHKATIHYRTKNYRLSSQLIITENHQLENPAMEENASPLFWGVGWGRGGQHP